MLTPTLAKNFRGGTHWCWCHGFCGSEIPAGKGIKVVKGAKKVSNAIDAAATLEKQRKTLKANSLAGKEYENKNVRGYKTPKT